MNRRDTIIVAVLINAGLLLILFITAINSGPTPSVPVATTVDSPSNEVEMLATAPSVAPIENEEVDQLFSELSDTSQDLLTEDKIASTESPSSRLVAPSVDFHPSFQNEYIVVTVKQGDYLAKIAKANGTTVEEIMRFNRLPNHHLQIGQLLKVPSKKTASPPHTVSANLTRDDRYYTIVSGDTPWRIAQKHNIKLDDLLKLNGLDRETAKTLRPGQKLRIR